MQELRGLVMTTTGWSSYTFDSTPLPVVMELLEYWSENPPTHVIQAAKAGLGKRKRPRQAVPEDVKPCRVLTPIEKEAESKLPEWVQQVRQQRREARKK